MNAADVVPCRHPGAAPEDVIDRVVTLFNRISENPSLLASYGITADEYELALPAAIERLRGSKAAGNSEKRQFLRDVFETLQSLGLVTDIQNPRYGDDTVYRLSIPNVGDVAIIQKGCPDGAHSSTRWARPAWAKEAYIWWLCSSTSLEPGEHITKGVNRLKNRFFSDAIDTIDGVIFHNNLCGSAARPCPKTAFSLKVGDTNLPPPCIYIMPDREPNSLEWNWLGTKQLAFPGCLLSAFCIPNDQSRLFTGYVGYQKRGDAIRTNITSRYGPGRSTTLRS